MTSLWKFHIKIRRAFSEGPFILSSQNFPLTRSFFLSGNLMVSTTSLLDCRFSKFYFFFQNGVETCVSENVVYAIKCHACHKIYIEETGRHLPGFITSSPLLTMISMSEISLATPPTETAPQPLQHNNNNNKSTKYLYPKC